MNLSRRELEQVAMSFLRRPFGARHVWLPPGHARPCCDRCGFRHLAARRPFVVLTHVGLGAWVCDGCLRPDEALGASRTRDLSQGGVVVHRSKEGGEDEG